MNVTDYMSESDWKKLVQFSEKLETPCVVINLDRIKKNYLELKKLFSPAAPNRFRSQFRYRLTLRA